MLRMIKIQIFSLKQFTSLTNNLRGLDFSFSYVVRPRDAAVGSQLLCFDFDMYFALRRQGLAFAT